MTINQNGDLSNTDHLISSTPIASPSTGRDRYALRARLAAMPPDAVFSTNEAAAYCSTGVSTWERKRMEGKTPAAIRLTARTLGYRKRVLDAWLDARTEHRAA